MCAQNVFTEMLRPLRGPAGSGRTLLVAGRAPFLGLKFRHSVLGLPSWSNVCLNSLGGVDISYKYRTVRVRGTDMVGTIARKHGSAPEIYETSKDPSTSVVPVFFQATGEVRFFDRSVLEDVPTPAD